MSDPIEVHRLRLISEMSRGNPILVEDLRYILHAYDTMKKTLEEIEAESEELFAVKTASEGLGHT